MSSSTSDSISPSYASFDEQESAGWSISPYFLWGTLAICVIPLLLKLLGMDWGSFSEIGPKGRATWPGLANVVFDWSVFCAGVVILVLNLLRFWTARDWVATLFGVALFNSGAMDGLRVLIANGLILTPADVHDFIVLSWPISRCFNGLLLVVAASLSLKGWIWRSDKGVGAVLGAVLALGLISFGLLAWIDGSLASPPASLAGSASILLIEIAALVLFLAAAPLLLRLHGIAPSALTYCLLLSLVPHLAAQLYLIFGSAHLFDHYFNAAQFLKLLAYLLPFGGLTWDYIQSYRNYDAEVLRRLRAAENRYRDLFDHAPDMMAVIDMVHGKVIECNQTLADTLGYTKEELVGGPFLRLYDNPSQVSARETFSTFAAQGRVARAERTMRRADGTSIHVLLDATTIRDETGKIVASRSTWRDITQLKKAQEDLESTAAELSRSNQELAQFAYVASHDLQEPLRMVTSYLQLLESRYRDQLDEDARVFIGYAVDGARRMRGLIEDLLSYSRVGTRGKPFEPTDCAQVVKQALLDLRAAIQESQAQIVEEELPTVMADATQLAQLFQNLIGNGIKFRGDTLPEIQISAERCDGEWQFAVRDNGIGIPPEYAERIFVIFQRLHTRNEYPGTGMGLAICKKIVERHGGRIWFESEPGKGSSFYFTIPTTETQAS